VETQFCHATQFRVQETDGTVPYASSWHPRHRANLHAVAVCIPGRAGRLPLTPSAPTRAVQRAPTTASLTIASHARLQSADASRRFELRTYLLRNSYLLTQNPGAPMGRTQCACPRAPLTRVGTLVPALACMHAAPCEPAELGYSRAHGSEYRHARLKHVPMDQGVGMRDSSTCPWRLHHAPCNSSPRPQRGPWACVRAHGGSAGHAHQLQRQR